MTADTIINRDALCALRELPAESVHCAVTSPPYYALRDYGLDAQIGREDTPEQYIERLTAVFHELKRVLRPDGTFWLNISDTYCGTGRKGGYTDPKYPKGRNGQGFSLARTAAGILPRSRRSWRKPVSWRAVPKAALSLTPFSAAVRRGLRQKPLTAIISALS